MGRQITAATGRPILRTSKKTACAAQLCKAGPCMTITPLNGRKNRSALLNTCSIYSRRAPRFMASESVDEMLAYGPRLSLKTQGFLGKPSAPMLVVNGEKMNQVPISDLVYADAIGRHGKWSWVNPMTIPGAPSGGPIHDRRGGHHALDQGSARTGVRKQTGAERRLEVMSLQRFVIFCAGRASLRKMERSADG